MRESEMSESQLIVYKRLVEEAREAREAFFSMGELSREVDARYQSALGGLGHWVLFYAAGPVGGAE